MYKESHFIQSLGLEMETYDTAEGLGFQRELRDVFYLKLMPQLEKIFDGTISAGQLVTIEYLPVHIEIEDAAMWQEELVRKAVRQISQVLKESPKKKLNLLTEDTGESKENDFLTDDFFYFLQYGYLRWNTSVLSLEVFETMLTRECSLYTSRQRTMFFEKMLHFFLVDTHIVKRLCYQFSTRLLQALIVEESLFRMLENWTAYFKELEDAVFFRIVVLKTWVKKRTAPVCMPDNKLLMQIFLENITDYASTQQWYRQQPAQEQAFVRSVLDKDFNKIVYAEMNNCKVVQHRREVEKRWLPLEKPADRNAFYIDNAGLVITHVFLENLFEAVEFRQDKKFVNENAHQKAVLLTGYLVNEETEYPEHDLLLNKILCGLPVECPLPLLLNITTQQKAESIELLQAITDNWKYNGRPVCTTIGNLRSSFLQRQGKLIKNDNAWLLQVERQGYDILLNGLSWGIGTIKLPWMENILHVEWI